MPAHLPPSEELLQPICLISAVLAGSPQTIVTAPAGHGLESGDQVRLSGTGSADGAWVVTVTAMDAFTLNGSSGGAGRPGGGVYLLGHPPPW